MTKSGLATLIQGLLKIVNLEINPQSLRPLYLKFLDPPVQMIILCEKSCLTLPRPGDIFGVFLNI